MNSGPNSPGYMSPAPAQHISRALNPQWDDANPARDKSKFRLNYLAHDGVRYWSPLDLTGPFITIHEYRAGSNMSDQEKLFSPIGGRARQVVHSTDQGPFMYNCTWKTDPNGH